MITRESDALSLIACGLTANREDVNCRELPSKNDFHLLYNSPRSGRMGSLALTRTQYMILTVDILDTLHNPFDREMEPMIILHTAASVARSAPPPATFALPLTCGASLAIDNMHPESFCSASNRSSWPNNSGTLNCLPLTLSRRIKQRQPHIVVIGEKATYQNFLAWS